MSRKGNRFWRIVRVRYRRAMARIDRNTPEWMQWITPYGTSLTLHGIVLLVLGFAIYINTEAKKEEAALDAGFPQQLKEEELTTVKEADVAGDPFAKETSIEPPSLSLTNAPDTKNEVLSVPELTNMKLSDTINTTPTVDTKGFAGVSAKGSGAASGPPMSTTMMGRSKIAGTKNVRRHGGTVHSEKAVQTGLDWVVRHQKDDGSWTLDPTPQCKVGSGCPKTPSMVSDTAATGLALLPLLGAGHSHTDPGSKYRSNVQRGIDWLVKHQKPDGDTFVGGTPISRMYSHAIATIVLCEGYGISGDEKLKGPAQKAVDFIIAARNKGNVGGWRYSPGQDGDTCVFGWQMFALRSAALAGMNVPDEVVQSCRDYLDKAATDPFKATYCYSIREKPNRDIVMTAEGLLCRQYLGWHRNNPAMIQGSSLVFEDLMKAASMSPEELAKSNVRNIYYWYYATQLLHNMQGPAWERWNVTIRETLINFQSKSRGCDQGSWDPLETPIGRMPDYWGKQAGRHFTTCMSLLTLEVYYRYLPLYSERDRDVADARKAPNPRSRAKDATATAAREKAEAADKERADKDKATKPK